MTMSLIMSSDWLVGLLVDVSLKSILLATLAAAGMGLLRVRNSSVRHRVWTVVLAGMLTMPLLVAWAPTVPLPTWAYPGLRSRDVQETVSTQGIDASATTLPIVGEAPKSESPTASLSVATQPVVTAAERPSEPAAAELPATKWTDFAQVIFAAFYVVGVAFFGGRLLVGFAAAQHLIRTAKTVELSPQQASAIGSTHVVQSSAVRVPLTVGWLRPTIVFPSDWTSWSEALLTAVLTHEQAHVRRRDPWVALVAQANRAIYWFHPLAWFLARRLTTLAESACDDVVIESLGDRAGYARHLLTIAGRLAGQPRRLQPTGVAMAACPAVEHRIEAILDDRRPLARRVGRAGSLIVLAAITPVVLLAAGITADKDVPKAETDPPMALASDTGRLRLTMLDDNDAPVPEGNVKVRIRQVFMGQDTYTHQQVDKSGQLDIEVSNPTPYYLSAEVTVPGFVPFLAEWENHDTPDPIPAEYTVRLESGRTIGGIVRDQNGQPIEGVAVHPQFNIGLREERTRQMGAGVKVKTNAEGEWIYPSLPTDIQQVTIVFKHPNYISQRVTESISKLASSSSEHPSEVVVMKRGIPIGGRVTGANGEPIEGATVTYYHDSNFSGDAPTASTDKAGVYEFTCGEVGTSLLTVSAPELAPAMKTIQITEGMKATDFQLAPGNLLKVSVVGPDQTPLAGAYVALWNWDEQAIYGSLTDSSGKTDANGIWQWSHAPPGRLQFAVSLAGFRYLSGEPLTPGQDNVVVMSRETAEVVAKRLISISGRVVDAETQAPIARFRVTAGYQAEAGGRAIWLQDSQSKGRGGAFRREFTQNDLGSDMYGIAIRVEADGYKPTIVQRVLADKNDFNADVVLEKAADEGFRVLMPSGEAAAGATVAVCTPEVGPIVQDGTVIPNSTCERTTTDDMGRFSIAQQKGMFDLLVLHDSGAAYITQLQLAKSPTISLEPWARVEGTLKIHGQPAANESIRLSRAQSPLMKAPAIHYQYQTTTAQDGTFLFKRVIPGKGQVARVAVTKLGGGASSWTPTLVSDAKFAPGETTHVELGRTGRQIVGKLVLPANAKPGNDWRRAMISLQSRPHNNPQPPKIPIPILIDPKKDPEAAKAWYQKWRFTDEGKAFEIEMKKYADAVNGFKPVFYGGRVEPDGTYTFDDIPNGDYQLQVNANAVAGSSIGPGETIARLDHAFSVTDAPAENSNEAFDLGELTLQSLKTPQPAP